MKTISHMVTFQVQPSTLCINSNCVQIDPCLLVELYGRHFEENVSPVFQEIFRGWVKALNSDFKELFLLYSLDDEYAEAFQVTPSKNHSIQLRCVMIPFMGWEFNFEISEICKFAAGRHKIIKKYPENFGEYPLKEFIAGLNSFISSTSYS